MSESTAIEVSSSLVPQAASIVRQAVPTVEVKAAQDAYHSLCLDLLDHNDVMKIGKKEFRKKSAWRKLAVAFNVSVELIGRPIYERNEAGHIIRAEVIARATAPNGRIMDGFGACDLYEKCCEGAYDNVPGCTNKSQYHKHCASGCAGRIHFSNPSHDLPATAQTRAVNRACADLFGMGEVSAEEINADRQRNYDGDAEPAVDWFVANGWTDEATARAQQSALIERIKAHTEDDREALKAKMAEAGIEVAKQWSRAQHDTIESWLPNAEPQPEVDKEAVAAERQAELDAAARDAELSDPDAQVDNVAEIVKRMNARGVDEELTRLKQHCEGPIEDRRHRLKLALLREQMAAV